MKMKTKHVIVKCKADFSMPLAAMFGVYVIMHGNSSPGGGFQGGVLMAITLLMFFLAYREKSAGPRPGSPEYEAIERAQASRIKASQERLYRKQHPFMVARELVESNKSIPSRAQKKTEPPKKDSVCLLYTSPSPRD